MAVQPVLSEASEPCSHLRDGIVPSPPSKLAGLESPILHRDSLVTSSTNASPRTILLPTRSRPPTDPKPPASDEGKSRDSGKKSTKLLRADELRSGGKKEVVGNKKRREDAVPKTHTSVFSKNEVLRHFTCPFGKFDPQTHSLCAESKYWSDAVLRRDHLFQHISSIGQVKYETLRSTACAENASGAIQEEHWRRGFVLIFPEYRSQQRNLNPYFGLALLPQRPALEETLRRAQLASMTNIDNSLDRAHHANVNQELSSTQGTNPVSLPWRFPVTPQSERYIDPELGAMGIPNPGSFDQPGSIFDQDHSTASPGLQTIGLRSVSDPDARSYSEAASRLPQQSHLYHPTDQPARQAAGGTPASVDSMRMQSDQQQWDWMNASNTPGNGTIDPRNLERSAHPQP